jgi:hypothetical protein
MSESSDPFGGVLEELIARLLRTVPEIWTEYDWASLSEAQERAIFLLTAAAMLERRITFRLRMSGHPEAVQVRITFTGAGGFAEAMEPVLADLWNDWRELFEEHQASELKDARVFRCERIGREQWRLTAEGVIARKDLETGQSSTVFDFVLQRGFFDGHPRLMPDGRIRQQTPVPGKGALERMQRVRSEPGPAGVKITNWAEGAKAFEIVLDKLIKDRETQALAPPELPDLVTLDQAAAAAHQSKRTLERHKTEGTLPQPVREGGGGKSALYDWKTMRLWLMKQFNIIHLPERFPGNAR